MVGQNDLGNRLYALRSARGLEKKTVADLLNITPDMYGKIETGNRGLKTAHVIALADFYNVSCDYILRGIEAENLDVCKQTGLQQETIAVLQKKMDELNKCAREVEKINAIALEKRERLINNVCESVKIKQFPALEILDDVQSSEKQVSIAYEKLRGGRAEIELLNFVIRDKELWKEIKRACNNIGDSMMDIVYTRTHSHDGSIPLDKEKEDLKGIDAARYVAGQAFAMFFSSLCCDSDFIKHITTLTEDDIQKAIKLGILFRKQEV